MPQPKVVNCEIFGLAGVLVQIALGVLSFNVLVVKRYREKPKRPWKIWCFDASKQAASQLIAHFINIAISISMSVHLQNDTCIWYFMTNILENSVGVLFCIGMLRAIEQIVILDHCQQFSSGNYYDILEYEDSNASVNISNNNDHYNQSITVKPFEISTKKQIIIISYFTWLVQFIIWNFIVVVCKTLLYLLEMWMNGPLSSFSQFILGWVQPYPTIELILVIIIIPVMMNGLAFWVQDNFLKKKSLDSDTAARQPLL